LHMTEQTSLLSAEMIAVQCGFVGILRVAQNDMVVELLPLFVILNAAKDLLISQRSHFAAKTSEGESMKICIYGASSRALEEIYYTEAEKLGALMAQRGHSLIFGGGAEGLMGAAARGVYSGGGEIIGIAPRFFDEPGILFPHCTELVYTDTMRERKALMEERSQAIIVLPGGIGTYEEFFEILTLKQLGRVSHAIVLLNTNNYFAPMKALLEHTAQERFMSQGCLDIFTVVDTPEDALAAIESYVPQTGNLKRLEDYNA